MEHYLHRVLGIYEMRAEAEAARDRLVERGLAPEKVRIYTSVRDSDRAALASDSDDVIKEVLRETATGREPRTMAISPDGLALYIVNYYADTVSKFDTQTLEEIQTVEVGQNPIGITYEPTQRRVWVANYAGSIDVFDDTAPAGDALTP